MPRKKTHEEYCLEVKIINCDIDVIEKYINLSTSIKHKCPICKEDWLVRPTDVLSGKATKCKKCYGNYKKTQEEYILEVNNINTEIEVVDEYIDAHTPILHKCPFCKNDWVVAPHTILNKKTKGCSKCGQKRGKEKTTRTHKDYLNLLKELNINICVIDKYINYKTKISHECPICKNKWMIAPCDILKGVKMCSRCSKNAMYTHEDYLNLLNDNNINIEVIGIYKGMG